MRYYRYLRYLPVLPAIYVFFFARRVLRFYRVNVNTWYGIILSLLPSILIYNISGSFRSMNFLTIGYFAGISILTDIIALTVRKAAAGSAAKPVQFLHVLYRSGLLPFFLTAAVILYGFFNVRMIVKTEYWIQTDKPVGEYTIVLLTDTHYGTIQPREVLKKKAAEISRLKPDLVILGGDIVEEGTSQEAMEEVFSILGGIDTAYGVYYVYGNHDIQPYTSRKSFSREELETAVQSQGIRILRDEKTQIAGELTLAGRADASWSRNANRMKIEDLLSGSGENTFIIVADHQPIDYIACRQSGADLLLSGHTHAGQIWPAGIFNELTGTLNYGLYHKEGIDVVVSSGVSGWGYPIRTGKHCEYVVVHLCGSGSE